VDDPGECAYGSIVSRTRVHEGRYTIDACHPSGYKLGVFFVDCFEAALDLVSQAILGKT
jgi:hypothetical protein